MSFFSNLQEYVSSSVASLSLSPKRFSFSRSDSGGGVGGGSGGASPRGSADASAAGIVQHPLAGFPRVVPSPGVEALPPPPGAAARRRSTLDALPTPPPRHGRPGSFRRQQPIPPPPDPPPPDFCARRASWPEIDIHATSGVHELDGSYFEHLSRVTWEQEGRREEARRDFKATFSEARPQRPPDVSPAGSDTEDFSSAKERDQLYVEMLYTIANTVGAPISNDGHYKEELYLFGQEAFGVSSDHHYRMLHAAGEEKPPIVVLNVVVVEAEGLEAKDANGFSDPYCMLGIQPMTSSPGVPTTPLSNRALSEGGVCGGSTSPGGHPELRKHHSFRLSFKRRETGPGGGGISGSDGVLTASGGGSGSVGPRGGRCQRDSLGSSAQLPAKFIRATSVRPHTLNPRWNEKFRFDIDDVSSDSLHLDIWDHDDESSVLEAVSKLNEIRGVRGLGRFFKQICQSARQSSQDDFLGCITVPLRDIPCTGLDAWFKLEARSHRSTVQGRIHLRMWLSTREDRADSEPNDNWEEILRYERLKRVFLRHASRRSGGTNWELPTAARAILHQQAARADLSELQRSASALAAYVAVGAPATHVLNALRDLHRAWAAQHSQESPPLTREQQGWLADTFSRFLERALYKVRRHRHIFCGDQAPNLEPLLRCLSTIASMPAFAKCCPFNKEIRTEIVGALRKGTTEWFVGLRNSLWIPGEPERSLTCLCSAIHVELEAGFEIYHSLFESINGINYFSIIYKQTDKLLSDEVCNYLNQHANVDTGARWALVEPELTAIIRMLAVYLELRDFGALSTQLSGPPGSNPLVIDSHRQLQIALHCHEWFELAVTRWLTAIKPRAMQRVRNAWRIAKVIYPSETTTEHRYVRHSTVSIDVARLLDSLRALWVALAWPLGPTTGATTLLGMILDTAATCTSLHGDLIRQKLDECGYYTRTGPFYVADDMCIVVNDTEYVCQCLVHIDQSLEAFDGIENCRGFLERAQGALEARIEETLSFIEPQMREALRKYTFHLAWSPDSLPTPQAISPLLEYLHTHLATLNKALLPNNFQRSLTHIWEAVLSALDDQVDAGGVSCSETPENFWPRLSEALEMLAAWWNKSGVPHTSTTPYAHTISFMKLEQRLRYHRTDSESLIETFHCQRLQDQTIAQQQSMQTPYGTLSVRTYFNHDSLCVEVLHARDIIPLDPNGYSDPFVIIELLPRRLFSRCAEQQTHVQKKTLHPMFDECFEFSVTLEACRDPSAMLAFTVMDHDVLTSNDFAGEAFLALSSIPGVADVGCNIDNFHGLKQIELVLMHQHDRHHPILQILETRPLDKMAVDFVKKQKMRMSTNS